MTSSLPCPGQKPVLVVEDDADVRDGMEDFLRSEGYSVQTAEDGRAALDMLARTTPCLILLDLMMPGMNGWDFLDAVQKTEGLVEVPVVILSAYRAPAGFQVLLKPVDLVRLLEVVAMHCCKA